MGQLISKSYTVQDGAEYADYLQHIIGEADRLRREGRLPDTEAVLSFFDDLRHVLATVRHDVAQANVRGEPQLVTRITVTAADHRRLVNMSESLANLLEILELRKAVEVKRSDGAARAAEAVREGTFLQT